MNLSSERRIACWVWFVLALACVAMAGVFQSNFIWNHFYSRGPYLLDASWLASIAYHAGLVPTNPDAIQVSRSFFDIHVSPLISLLSTLSAATDMGMVRWYQLTQGTMYAAMVLAPCGFGVYWLHRTSTRRQMVGSMGLCLAVLLATTFSGQVLMCWAYPHFEIMIPVLVNLALVAWASGHRTIAAVCVAAAAGVREDGGLQAALGFFSVASWLWLRACRTGDAGPTRSDARMALQLAVLGLALGVAAIIAQNLFFDAQGLLRTQYIGNPAFSHLTPETLLRRAFYFFQNCRFIWYPLVLSMALALVVRSSIPVVGWMAYAPWLLFNLLAAADSKAELSVYIGFPFIISMFMPFALVVWRDRLGLVSMDRQRGMVAGLVLCTLASALGMVIDKPMTVATIIHDSVRRDPGISDVATEVGLSRFLEKVPAGGFQMDRTVAGLLLDRNPSRDTLVSAQRPPDGSKPVLFAGSGLAQAEMTSAVARLKDGRHVWLVPGTFLRAWMPAGAVLPAPWRKALLLGPALSIAGSGVVRKDADGSLFRIGPDAPRGFAIWGPYLELERGIYQVRWRVDGLEKAATPAAGVLDVAVGEKVIVGQPVTRNGPLVLRFTINPDQELQPVEFRYWHEPGSRLDLRLEALDRLDGSAAIDQGGASVSPVPASKSPES